MQIKTTDDSSNKSTNNLKSEEYEDEDSDFEEVGGKTFKGTKAYDDSDEEEYDPRIDAIEQITDHFTKTFSKIQGDPRLKEGVLQNVGEHDIKRLIKNAKKRISYRQKKQNTKDAITLTANLSKKRTSTQAQLLDCNPESKKRVNISLDKEPAKKTLSIAETLILNFTNLNEHEIKEKIIAAVDKVLKDDPILFQKALEKQVQVLQKQAIEYYEDKQQVKLSDLLSSVSPMAAILLNIQITLVNNNMSEEGNTLSHTLLPYLNQCTDFTFLSDDTNFFVNRYLQSMALNIKDSNMEAGKGFMILALKMNPSLLQGIIASDANQSFLVEALLHSGFKLKPALIIAQNPKKFLWPQLLKFFSGKSEDTVSDCITILSKMDILSDPGDLMNTMLDIFAYRRIVVDLLIKAPTIQLSLSKLLITLETIKRLNSETIKQCLEHDSSKWESLALSNQSKEDIGTQKINIQVLTEIYQKHTLGIDKPVLQQELFDISIPMSEEIEEYRHCEYQSTIAAIVASQGSGFQVVTMPTGSGKTWVQGLIAKYYCLKGKTVTVIEPNAMLTQQTTEKIGLVHHNINVVSIQDFYQYGTHDEVIIIDEYDSIITQQSYTFVNSTITGVWSLRGKRVIAFSATSAPEVERLVNNCIEETKVLKFISEYELINGTSPIQDGHIVACGAADKVVAAVDSEIEKHYDIKPIIIVADQDQIETITQVIYKQKYKHLVGVSNETLNEIKDLDYGIIIVDAQECRGVDVRFQKDAIVLIISRVKTYQEYLQMLGRGSRTRNISEGILFIETTEKPNIVMQRLKKSNVAMMQDLEKILHFLEQRALQKVVVETVSKEYEQGKLIMSMSEMQKKINPKQYASLIKDVKFTRAK